MAEERSLSDLQNIRPTMLQETGRREIIESGEKRPKGWLRRNKKTVVVLVLIAIILAGVLLFGFYQVKKNREFMDTLSSRMASDDQHPHASALQSGFQPTGDMQKNFIVDTLSSGMTADDPHASALQNGVPLTGDMQKYFLSIGMRQDYLLQDCQGIHYKLSFPDVDYALMGYNVLRGYPLASGHDPGFTYPIFTADYGSGLQTADCRYSVPKGLIVVPDVSCVTSFSSQIVQTKYEFANALSTSASVSGGGWGVSFSASAGYKQSSSEMSTGESVYIISSANCQYYFSKLKRGSPPPFDPIFLSWIKRLNNTNLKDIYLEFFDTYGTHFATEVTFGARFTYEHKMSTKNYEAQSKKGVNVAVQAGYSGLVNVGGGFGMDSSQREAASNFSKMVETKTITVGAAPPANGDAMTWASTVKNSPVPSKYKLASIEELFTETYMEPAKLNVNLTLISQNVRKFKYEYCKYLMLKGEVESCESLSPGMVLDKTRLFNHYGGVVLAYKDCIDYCLKQIKCVAISYCDQCDSSNVFYRTCYLYNADVEIRAEYENGWKSIFFIGKMNTKLYLGSTEVVGTDRGFGQEYNNANETKCSELCAGDVYCIVYSYCECPSVAQKCKLYSFKNVLGFKKESGTKSVIAPKFEN